MQVQLCGTPAVSRKCLQTLPIAFWMHITYQKLVRHFVRQDLETTINDLQGGPEEIKMALPEQEKAIQSKIVLKNAT